MILTGLPSSIRRSTYLWWIEWLGIDPAECKSISLHVNSLEVVMFARNEDGRRFATTDENGDDVMATHTISIPIVD